MRHSGRKRAHRIFGDVPRGVTAAGIAAVTAAALLAPGATATTTVSGGDAGTNPPVVRGSSTTITSDMGALTYFRSGTFAAGTSNVNTVGPEAARARTASSSAERSSLKSGALNDLASAVSFHSAGVRKVRPSELLKPPRTMRSSSRMLKSTGITISGILWSAIRKSP